MNNIQETSSMAVEAVRLTTTLNYIKKADACVSRYRHLVNKLGGVSFDHKAPINLLTILEHNGVDDCLWALCAAEQNCDKVARLMAADFAESVLHIFEKERPGDDRPRRAIAVAKAFARGEIEDAARTAARDAAWAAAKDAARDAAWATAKDAAWAAAWAAWAAARDAAWAAARDAAWATAKDAAWAAAWAAWAAARDAAWATARDAAWDTQAQIIRRYLLP